MFSATRMAGVTIHRGNVADATELAAFAARTFRETYAADNSPEDMQDHLASAYGSDQQSAELTDPSVATILARSNGEIIAYAQARQSRPPSCVTHAAPIELYRFYVDRRAHGAGLAGRLMQAVYQAAREFQGRHLWLSVWERNPRAIAFYKKVGFEDVGSTFFMVGPDKQTDRVLVAQVPANEPGGA